MRRLLPLLALLLGLLIPSLSLAQTTVTGTVVDANGNAYYPGTVSAYIVLPTGSPRPSGVPASGSIGPFRTTIGGNFSVVVASPYNWVFTICGLPTNIKPRGNATPTQQCFSTSAILISGSSHVITGNLGVVPVLGNGFGSLTSVSVIPGSCAPKSSPPLNLTVSPYGIYH